MINRNTTTLSLLALLIIALAPGAVHGDQVLFSDDFSGGDKDWEVEIGEWYVSGGQSYCSDDCGT
jgi:hypothetical protein